MRDIKDILKAGWTEPTRREGHFPLSRNTLACRRAAAFLNDGMRARYEAKAVSAANDMFQNGVTVAGGNKIRTTSSTSTGR